MLEFYGTWNKLIFFDQNFNTFFIYSRYMRQECLNYKYMYGSSYPVGRLIGLLGLKMQVCTQRYDRRPYGVGLLVAGYDVS